MGLFDKLMGKEQKAIVLSDEAIKKYNTHMEKGNTYKAGHMWDQAIKEYEEATRINPNDFNAHLYLGISYHERGKIKLSINDDAFFSKAQKEFNKAIKINPQNAEAYINSAKTAEYQNTGDFGLTQTPTDFAIGRVVKAIEIDPGDIDFRYYLANLYKRAGQHEKAANEYNEAIKMKPGNIDSYLYLANVYQKAGQYEKALDEYNKAIKIDPTNIGIRYSLAGMFINQGLYNDAKKVYIEVLKIDPKNKEMAEAIENHSKKEEITSYYGKWMLYPTRLAVFLTNKRLILIPTGDAGLPIFFGLAASSVSFLLNEFIANTNATALKKLSIDDVLYSSKPTVKIPLEEIQMIKPYRQLLESGLEISTTDEKIQLQYITESEKETKAYNEFYNTLFTMIAYRLCYDAYKSMDPQS